MKHLSRFSYLLALFLGASLSTHAQGDSDPGMGSLGAMRPNAALKIGDENYENLQTHFSVGNAFAKGDRDIKLITPQVEIRVPLSDYGYFDVKLPYHVATGDLASVSGIGDLMAAYTFMPYTPAMITSDWMWQFTAGARIGLSNASLTDGRDRGLPMAYQGSLGSTDVILGGSVKWKDYLTVAVGYQQPVFRYNFNSYYGTNPVNDLMYGSKDNQISSNLYRNGDVMMRVEGHIGNERLGIGGGPLAFYHLRNDLTTDRNNYTTEIKGSQGFTLNAVGNAYIRLGRYASYKFDITGSFPITERDIAPDGLRRQWVFMPRFTYFFNQRNLIF